jgi:ATP-dependent protease ClpP protease subunit
MKVFLITLLTGLCLIASSVSMQANDRLAGSSELARIQAEKNTRYDCEKINPYKHCLEQDILSRNTSIIGDIVYMRFWSTLTVSDTVNFWNDIMELYNETDYRDVDFFISSGGGDAFTGLALADYIVAAKKLGFVFTAHATGIVASAAVPIYAAANQRYATPSTIFMVHEAALWKWPGQETASDIASQNRLMIMLAEHYREILAAATNLTATEWGEMESKTTWFGVDKAMEWGLVHKIEGANGKSGN